MKLEWGSCDLTVTYYMLDEFGYLKTCLILFFYTTEYFPFFSTKDVFCFSRSTVGGGKGLGTNEMAQELR